MIYFCIGVQIVQILDIRCVVWCSICFCSAFIYSFKLNDAFSDNCMQLYALRKIPVQLLFFGAFGAKSANGADKF